MKGVHRLPQLSAEGSQGRRPQGTRHLVCARRPPSSRGPCPLVRTGLAFPAQTQLRLLRRPDQLPVSSLTWHPGRGPCWAPRSAMAARGLFSAEVLVRRRHTPLVQVASAYFKQPRDRRDVAFFCACCLRV